MNDASEAAQLARLRLQEEIERVRSGVEEMLGELDDRGRGDDIRSELKRLRIENRDYVKRRVRKSEKRLEKSVRKIDNRTEELERRIDRVEAEREQAEWRIHNNTELMLDGLLHDVRAIADRLSARPAPRATRSRCSDPPAPCAGRP
jgi:chromosome segregation ATPase